MHNMTIEHHMAIEYHMTIDHQNVSEDVVQLVTNNKHIRFKIVVNLDIDI